MTKREWLERNGFNAENEITYCVVGEDTYSIKEYLKAAGLKYSPLLGWHGPSVIKLNEDYSFVSFSFDEIAKWEGTIKEGDACYFEESNNIVKRKIKKFLPRSKSKFVGAVGERLYNVTSTLKNIKGYFGTYGWVNIYTFQNQKNLLVWFTQKDLKIKQGEPVLLTGTIKAHQLYRETETTVLTRCIVKSIETKEK